MNYVKTIKDNFSAITVTYGSMIFEGAIITLLVALMTPLSARLNVSTGVVSTLLTAQGFGTVATVYISGNISDKIGKQKMILFGLIFYFIFLIGMMITTNFYIALFLSLLAGMGHGFMDSPAISMLIDIFGDFSGPAMSVVAVFFSGGGAMSSIIVGRLLALNLDFRIIFIIYLVIATVVAFVALKANYPKRQKREKKQVDAKTQQANRKTLLATASFLALITFLFASANVILRTWIPTYSLEVLKVSIEKSINMLTFLQIGNVLGAFFFAYILTKIHATKVMVVNGLVATISLVLLLLFNKSVIPLIMLSGAVLSIGFSLALNIVGELFIENSGQATGFIGTSVMAAGMVMTFITGRLLPIIGVNGLMWISVAIVVIAAVLSIFFRIIFIRVKKLV